MCCNCYIMRVSLTFCHNSDMFFYLLISQKALTPLNRWKIPPAPAGIWFLPTAVLLYTSMKSGNRPSQINHAGWRFLQTVLAELRAGGAAWAENGASSWRVRRCADVVLFMSFNASSPWLRGWAASWATGNHLTPAGGSYTLAPLVLKYTVGGGDDITLGSL